MYLRSAAPDELWREYFDLDRDYAAATHSFDGGEYLAQCVEFGRGIRILRQDRWEWIPLLAETTLGQVNQQLSQCNNITRIKGIVERLCAMFGDELEFEGERFYSFPPAERLAGLQAADLAPLRCGYRAPYIIDAAVAVASGALELDRLAAEDGTAAKKALLKLNGVGEKVANCVVLFGL